MQTGNWRGNEAGRQVNNRVTTFYFKIYLFLSDLGRPSNKLAFIFFQMSIVLELALRLVVLLTVAFKSGLRKVTVLGQAVYFYRKLIS